MADADTARLVHIVDDDPEVCDSIAFMLRAAAVETTRHATAEDFLRALPDLMPGCILLDIFMPGLTGLELQAQLARIGCRMPIIIITGHGDVTSAVVAMKGGAIDFLQKPFTRADLLAALEAGWSELRTPHPGAEERERAASMLRQLTPRERQVVEGLVKGYPNKTIAYDLGISPRTVELYRATASRKLKARSLSELLQIAFHAGMA